MGDLDIAIEKLKSGMHNKNGVMLENYECAMLLKALEGQNAKTPDSTSDGKGVDTTASL